MDRSFLLEQLHVATHSGGRLLEAARGATAPAQRLYRLFRADTFGQP